MYFILKPRNALIVLFWCFGLYLLMQISQYAGIFVASILSGSSFESVISGEFTNHLTILGQGLTALIIGVPIVYLIINYLWRRPGNWLCREFNSKLLVYGVVFGVVSTLIVLGFIKIFGSVEVTGVPSRFSVTELISIITGSLGYVIFVSISEEFVFRGMAVREWAFRSGWVKATIYGGLFFGGVHLIGLIPKLTLFDAIWIVIAALFANMLFVSLYISSKSLWLPIGYHIGWNYGLKTILGITMSGKESSFGLYSIEVSGSEKITGGIFGVEASIVAMIFCLVMSILVLTVFKSKKIVLLSSKP